MVLRIRDGTPNSRGGRKKKQHRLLGLLVLVAAGLQLASFGTGVFLPTALEVTVKKLVFRGHDHNHHSDVKPSTEILDKAFLQTFASPTKFVIWTFPFPPTIEPA